MGQRSQIYIRYHNKQGVQLIARYFGWNYGERMISRARGIIEWLNSYMKYSDWLFDDKNKMEILTRMCDVNFDMRDIFLSGDILQEIREELYKEAECDGTNRVLFGQDNNDGQLLIDVAGHNIKYAFIPYYTEPDRAMDGDEYMVWNIGKSWRTKNWGTPNDPDDVDAKTYTIENIEYISKSATLMTPDEIREFVSCDYTGAVFGYPF